MERFNRLTTIVFSILLFTIVFSCKKDQDEFKASVPVTYYLIENKGLSTSPSAGDWNYIVNYIYPESVTTCEWSIFSNNNITKNQYGYDLVFWSASQAKVKIEFILDDGISETVIASKEQDIPYIDDSTGIHCHADIQTRPLLGTNPASGKGNYLVFRITHILGENRVEVFYGAKKEHLGCATITVYTDQ